MDQPKCQICNRDLENLDSITRGIGPECLAKREKFLAAAGSNDHEIAMLALCGDPTVTRWIAMLGKAIGSGRQDHVNRFIEAARCAYEAARMSTGCFCACHTTGPNRSRQIGDPVAQASGCSDCVRLHIEVAA